MVKFGASLKMSCPFLVVTDGLKSNQWKEEKRRRRKWRGNSGQASDPKYATRFQGCPGLDARLDCSSIAARKSLSTHSPLALRNHSAGLRIFISK
jgi:hypothetical protein